MILLIWKSLKRLHQTGLPRINEEMEKTGCCPVSFFNSETYDDNDNDDRL